MALGMAGLALVMLGSYRTAKPTVVGLTVSVAVGCFNSGPLRTGHQRLIRARFALGLVYISLCLSSSFA
jgi:hypothetical protein